MSCSLPSLARKLSGLAAISPIRHSWDSWLKNLIYKKLPSNLEKNLSYRTLCLHGVRLIQYKTHPHIRHMSYYRDSTVVPFHQTKLWSKSFATCILSFQNLCYNKRLFFIKIGIYLQESPFNLTFLEGTPPPENIKCKKQSSYLPLCTVWQSQDCKIERWNGFPS